MPVWSWQERFMCYEGVAGLLHRNTSGSRSKRIPAAEREIRPLAAHSARPSWLTNAYLQ
jgi:hypothetical protein